MNKELTFKGELYGGQEDEVFTVVAHTHKELLWKIFDAVSLYANKYDLQLPLIGYSDGWEEEEECPEADVMMLQSNLYADALDFDIDWENLMKGLGRGKL